MGKVCWSEPFKHGKGSPPGLLERQNLQILFQEMAMLVHFEGFRSISGPVSEVINFLAELHREGYQSSSLNVFRSAISSVYDKVDGMEVWKHPTITHLLKGAFRERPPCLAMLLHRM